MLGRLLPLLAALLLLAAAPPADRPKAGERVRVVAVPDGDTLELEDGRRVRLAGIEAAKPPPGRESERAWPLADAATAALRDLTLGRAVELHAAAEDRYGRQLAQVRREDGLWVQGELLLRGHARVLTRADARERAAELLAAEADARAAQRGIWRTRVYAVRSAGDLEQLRRDRDSVQLVEGRVLHVATVRGETFLNFGEDWRTDFTIVIDRDARRLFARTGLDPQGLEGRVVRVRGWVGVRNGPMIEATHPEQLEVIGDDALAHPAAPDEE